MARAVADDLDHTGLGLRLRYLSGGMSDEARTVDRYVLPERAGYYLGARMIRAGDREPRPSRGPCARAPPRLRRLAKPR